MENSKPTTEQASNYDNLEKMSTRDLLCNMNREDKSVPLAVEKVLPEIERLIDTTVSKMKEGGRLFYIGAGTSGRLGVLDASECPPTFGVSDDWVIGLIAGGDTALRKSVENAEDDEHQAWKDLLEYGISEKDILVGIAASGSTPYAVGGVVYAKANGVTTGCITCNSNSRLAREVDFPVEVIVGPEFVSGSTRMKAGTAQKLVLNMISTGVMIKMGRVVGNKMVDMMLSNSKLLRRGERILMEELGVSEEKARQLILKHRSVRGALEANKKY